MPGVCEVRNLGRGHWRIKGSLGPSIEWDARITQLIPNKIMAWKSMSGSPIESKGK